MRNYESIGTYDLKDRGHIIQVKLDKTIKGEDLRKHIGEKILIDYKEYPVYGLESFATITLHEGSVIGVLVSKINK